MTGAAGGRGALSRAVHGHAAGPDGRPDGRLRVADGAHDVRRAAADDAQGRGS